MHSSDRFSKKYFLKLSGWGLALLIFFLLALGVFALITNEIIFEKEEKLDHSFFHFLAPYVSAGTTRVMKLVTYCASSRFLQIGYLILISVFLLQKNWKRSIEILLIGIGGYLINYFMKIYFNRPRPADPLIDPLHNFSFPSGHATSAFIFYGLLAYLLYKKETLSNKLKGAAIVLLISFSLLIGFSRIYLRVHYLSDVMAGFCIGFAWLALSIWLMEYLKKESGKELRSEDAVRAGG